LDLKQILLHLENSKSFQFLWSSNWRLEPSKMLEPPTYVLQESKHHIIRSCWNQLTQQQLLFNFCQSFHMMIHGRKSH
jgi:hypothetical protein